ncbi:hypothetical protein TNIN_24001 [Trichonephila inaurata madagascariensis]|uniref:Uncharacterized protein n=1 Tax=Trichonephila inaurata madagascariensis TaxID=2747483 RepID=A0A8X6YFR4_9ARAC|nr:hypothetical protein TNIN_24001 [Trichonephila inaurata madagascariensis]
MTPHFDVGKGLKNHFANWNDARSEVSSNRNKMAIQKATLPQCDTSKRYFQGNNHSFRHPLFKITASITGGSLSKSGDVTKTAFEVRSFIGFGHSTGFLWRQKHIIDR